MKRKLRLTLTPFVIVASMVVGGRGEMGTGRWRHLRFMNQPGVATNQGSTHEAEVASRTDPDVDRRVDHRRGISKQGPRALRHAGDLVSRALTHQWPILADQAIARVAAGLPAATPGDQIRSMHRYGQLLARRKERTIPDVTGVIGLADGLAALQGGPCIVTFPHLGAFESAASLLHEHYPERDHQVTVVTDDCVSPHAPGRILIDRYDGWRAVSIYDGNVGPAALGTLINGGVLLVSSDVCPPNQRNEKDAAPVRFLGIRNVLLPTGVAKLALAAGAKILPVGTYLDGDACHVRIEQALDCDSRLSAAAITQDLADVNTRLICRAPNEWFPAFPLTFV